MLRWISRTVPVVGFLFLSGVACSSDLPPPPASQAILEGLPIAPLSARVEAAGGPEAVEARYRSGLPADSVAAWYRRWLFQQGWRLSGDARMPDGTTVLHAELEGRPVWIMIQPVRRGGSLFSLMSAAPGNGSSTP